MRYGVVGCGIHRSDKVGQGRLLRKGRVRSEEIRHGLICKDAARFGSFDGTRTGAV